jgi:small subunit ribosomal protein S16
VTVKLRLMRVGKKKQPTYRVVAADSRSPRDGRFIETVGTYAPRADPSTVVIDNARAVGWLAKGAQPTETVRKLLVISGAWEQFASGRPSKPARTRERPRREGGASGQGPASASTAKAGASRSTKSARRLDTHASGSASETDVAPADEKSEEGDES